MSPLRMAGAKSRAGATTSLTLGLDGASPVSLERQLYAQLRDAIICRRVRPGTRVPSTRSIAADLHCSRSTVVIAFDRLLAEGYLVGKHGSGTFVASAMPEDLMLVPEASAAVGSGDSSTPSELSQRGEAMAALTERKPLKRRPFDIGVPDTELFPFQIWGALLAQFWRNPRQDLLAYGPPQGYLPLLEQLSDYLRQARGVHCVPQQIFVTSGAQQAHNILAHLLLDPGDSVCVEEPGYIGTRGAMLAAGAKVVPAEVDEEGMTIERAMNGGSKIRAAVVTPSHQFPLGVVMSLKRRLELLDWAETNNAWIIEDDYDSEFRYTGAPLTSLQGLSAGPTGGRGRIVYVGSFSKVLFPGLRVGYMVVPLQLVDEIARARRVVDTQAPTTIQPVLAEFLRRGHFLTHIRRVRRLYEERQGVLIKHAEEALGDRLELRSHPAGMHLVADLKAKLRRRMTDTEAARRAAELDIHPRALAEFYIGAPRRSALLMGYAGMNDAELKRAVRKLSDALS